MPRSTFIHGDAIDLCPIERDDLPFLQRNWNDPDVRHWMPSVEPTNEHAMEREIEEFDEDDESVRLLAITPDDDPVGLISLFLIQPVSGRAFLGAWVDPAHHGNGYGTEMAELMVAYAFEERRLHKLEAGALATNDRSRHVLESVGFVEEGRQREHYFVDGEYVDRVQYGLLESEW